MIFRPEMADKVVMGSKTVTRRPAKIEAGNILDCRYIEGRTYAVQRGRGQRGVARIRIINTQLEMLHEIDQTEAIREGFPSVAAFMDYWRKLYGDNFDPYQDVWRIRFELVPTAGEAQSPDECASPTDGEPGLKSTPLARADYPETSTT